MNDSTERALPANVAERASPANVAERALPANVRTLPELLAWRVARTPSAQAYRHFDSDNQAWVNTTWSEFGARVARWVTALATLGLPRGSRVAILLPNGLDAVCMDQAALALALVPVPLHALDNPQSIAYILTDSDAALLVVATEAQWQAIAALGEALPVLRHVVIAQKDISAPDSSGCPSLHALAPWLSRAIADAEAEAEATERLPHLPVAEQDLAALVYTSGTTGKPKGVMLTHANVVSNVDAVLLRVAPQIDDLFLSFLPLSHTFERTAGYYLPIAAGCCVAFARSVAQLAEDFKVVRPTILISVPRIYERVYARLHDVLSASSLNAWLFEQAQSVGWRRFCRAQSLPDGKAGSRVLDALAWLVLQPLVARRVLAQFGGRLRVAVSGGAPLSPPIARCFLGLGLALLQGYGMTETSPVVAANAPDDNDPATVGRPLRGVDVRIGDNLELLVRGPNVMQGYWRRDEDTGRAFTDGWLRTGDQAAIVNGRVRILGRVKEIIVTSTGEKIAPADLEMAIAGDPLFEQAYVFGDNRPFIACIVVLNPVEWKRLAQGLQLDPAAPSSLRDARATATVLARIGALTLTFPRYAQPRAVSLSVDPWTTENTLLTPTLKIKRHNLDARFATQIEAMYRRQAPA
jgi:long-chain acyl-CoA synthetase